MSLFGKLPEALKNRVIRHALRMKRESLRRVGLRHIDAVKQMAILILGPLGQKDKRIIEPLVKLLQSDNPRFRQYAVLSFYKLFVSITRESFIFLAINCHFAILI